jgi:hypothetical protein
VNIENIEISVLNEPKLTKTWRRFCGQKITISYSHDSWHIHYHVNKKESGGSSLRTSGRDLSELLKYMQEYNHINILAVLNRSLIAKENIF